MRRHAKVLVAALTLLAVLGVATATADTAPSATIEAPSEVRFTTAHLSGHVNPNAGPSVAHWHFEFSKDPVGEGWSQAQDHEMSQAESEETNPIAVQDELSNLSPNTEYFVRLVASNDGGQNASSEEELETEEVTAPVVSVEDATSVTASSAHFEGHVTAGNPDPAFDSSCAFDYVTDSQFQSDGFNSAQQVGCDVNPVTGTSAVAVQAEPTNLQPNTIYHLRIRAQNQGGTGTEVAASTFNTAGVAPIVTQPGSTPLGQGEMGVGAFVTPGNATITDCRFEYGLSTSYGQSAPCLSTPPPDNQVHIAAAHISGLTPGATYHYRLSVTSTIASAQSEDGILKALDAPSSASSCSNAGSLGVSQLPDCRAWEMVSPPDKNGGDIAGQFGRTQAAADGSALAFSSLAGFAGAPASTVATEYLAERSSDPSPGDNGWKTHGITPPQASLAWSAAIATMEPHYWGTMSPDLEKGVFLSYSPLSEDPAVAHVLNLYEREGLHTPGNGTYKLLTGCPLCTPGSALPPLIPALIANHSLKPMLLGTTSDYGTAAFESIYNLTADAPAQSPACNYTEIIPLLFFCHRRLYEWDHGTVRLAGVKPDGTPAQVAVGGTGNQGTEVLASHAVSDGSDGHTRVFFTIPGSEAEETEDNGVRNLGNLYVREDHDTTIKLNASERTVPDNYSPAEYEDASADGGRVFFRTPEALTNDAPANGTEKLYMYDTEKPASDPHNLTLLSSPGSTAVEGVLGASEDGHYVYFLTERPLLRGAPDFLSNKAVYHIYLWHDGSLTEVSALSSRAFSGVEGEDIRNRKWSDREARVSPDGRHLLFSAKNGEAILSPYGGTDYDQEHLAGCRGGTECHELYIFDATTKTLACASCNPSGAPATADASTAPTQIRSGGAQLNPYENHALSSDGRYVFFFTAERLVPEDIDGQTDAYVYDTATGRPYLLSSGESNSGSYFLDASANGRDAFLMTSQPLSGWDHDTNYDVYDARIGGGLPEPPPAPPSCQGDACQPVPTQLNDPTPSSSSLRGAGNVHAAHKKKAHKHKRRRRHGRKGSQVRKNQHRQAKHDRRNGR